MASWVHLQLDTHAPTITWGDISGADAGETLGVGYTLDEPAITGATLELPSGAVLVMNVGPDVLTVDIPGDSTIGDATLRATVEDDVGNQAVRTLSIALGGVIPPVQVASTGGLPRGARFEPRVIRDTSRALARSRDSVTVTVAGVTTVGLATRYVLPTTRRSSWRTTATAQSTGRITGKLTGGSSARAVAGSDIVRRREGPSSEDELLLLDLL